MDAKQTSQVLSADHPIIQQAFEKIRIIAKVPEEKMPMVDDWMDRVILYNVPKGKLGRLLQVVQAFELFSKEPVTEKGLEKAAILGWIIEFFQAFALVLDDIMDKSQTRRGQLCWYLVEDVGLKAANDSVMLLIACFNILKKEFSDHPAYLDLTHTLLQLTSQITRGQCLDMLQEHSTVFEEDKYNLVAKFKTSLYTFSVPIRFGLYLAGVRDPAIHKKIEELAIRIGIIFQIQDDYLDCYGDPEKIGKIGTDIIDGKYSWILVRALQVASKDQKRIILENIGKGKTGGPEEAIVKKIYKDLKMEDIFKKHEEETFASIRSTISQLEKEGTLDTRVLTLTVDNIYKRQK